MLEIRRILKIIMKRNILRFCFLALFCAAAACSGKEAAMSSSDNRTEKTAGQLAKATFGGGCFWCVEAVFQNVKGVLSVESGYAGGTVANPTYEQVCTGKTGHAEVCQITYDPGQVSFRELLEVFWQTHDPTTPNRQGNDVGPQYRSIIFYHTPEQKELAEKYKKELDGAGLWSSPIVTEIVPFTAFYKAEDYHQDYYQRNRNQPYCLLVITPKVEKFRKVFQEKLKK
jgi:peptide-methionine (S)-S-oxide reductase